MVPEESAIPDINVYLGNNSASYFDPLNELQLAISRYNVFNRFGVGVYLHFT